MSNLQTKAVPSPLGKKIVGIDLGTCFSCCAHITDQKIPETIFNKDAMPTPVTPSAVMVEITGDEKGTPVTNIIVGQTARDEALTRPNDVVTLVKRLMGTQIKVHAGGREFAPEEISAMILKKLKKDAEQHLGTPVKAAVINDAVITVPAYFGAAEIKATQDAGEMAGFTVHYILKEPVATALAFGFMQPGVQRTLLVYDLGGGTFDITLFKIGPAKDGSGIPDIEMISTGGNRTLGGADWDQAIVKYVGEEFLREHPVPTGAGAVATSGGTPWDPREDPALRQKLLKQAGEARAALAQSPSTEIVCDHNARTVKVTLDQKKIEELAKLGPNVDDAIMNCVAEAFLREFPWDPRNDLATRQDLLARAEKAKIALGQKATATLVCQHNGLITKVTIDQNKLKELTGSLLEMTRAEVHKLMHDTGYSPNSADPEKKIDQILLAGGSTKMKMVREMLEEPDMFPGKVNAGVDADQCVAHGAAWMGYLLSKGEHLPVATVPLTFGVRALTPIAGKFEPRVFPLVYKDTKLAVVNGPDGKPVSTARGDDTFATMEEGARALSIDVYETDSKPDKTAAGTPQPLELDMCRLIGKVPITGLPPGLPKGTLVKVEFVFDVSQRLWVGGEVSGVKFSGDLDVGSGMDAGRKAATIKLLESAKIE